MNAGGMDSPQLRLPEQVSDANGTFDWSTAVLALTDHAAQAGDAILAPIEHVEVFNLPLIPCFVHGREVPRPRL
jgi:hypothetical protein